MTAARSALTSILFTGLISAAALNADLSKYRNFQLGTDLAAVAAQAGADPSQATVVHRRPALIQELDWRPQPHGSSSKAEAVQNVVFTFYDGALFRIAIDYDRYQTEGLTTDDFVQAISMTYGTAEKPAASVKTAPAGYGERQDIVARWQDSQYAFDLIRSEYGPTFRLVGVLKRLQAPAQAAIAEAKRLDDKEAPQREAARIADSKEADRAKLEQSRLLNKAKFQP